MNNQNKGEAMEAKVIKTAQQRAESDGWQVSMEQYRREEIADLRAALASAQEEIMGLRKDAERYHKIQFAVEQDSVSFRKMSPVKLDSVVDVVLPQRPSSAAPAGEAEA